MPQDETGVYKNLLQETAHRAGLKLPVYTTIRSGPGHTPVFSCTVELAGLTFNGDPAKTKKQAQKNAAMAAWSALKKLPNLGSSSSSSSLSENEGNEEQEQFVIARALASLHQAEENKSSSQMSQSDRQDLRRKPAPVRRDTSDDDQMWQQEQASLLTLPTPDISDPRLLPFFPSAFQPTQGQYFMGIEQDLIDPAPCFSKPSLGLPLYFSEYPPSVSARNQSQVTIQEIPRDKDQADRTEWVYLSASGDNSNSQQVNHQSDASVFHPEDTCGTSKVQELLEDDNTAVLSNAEGSSSCTSRPSSVHNSGKISTAGNDYDEFEKPVQQHDGGFSNVHYGVEYAIPNKDMSQSPVSEDMEESPRNRERQSYFNAPVYGPVPPEAAQDWQQTNGYDVAPDQVVAAGYQGDWQNYQYAEQMAYPEQYLQQNIQEYDALAGVNLPQDPRFMTQEDKDRGLGSVVKRDDQRLQQLREKDAEQKDPNFISESYSEYAILVIRSTIVRLWTVMMKVTCQKWTWVAG
ncbi:hypothetical protein J5N97_018150 [Dioscorea zingiberensis]|uniref:DRBM domain-containing protein n=1 Tax=Dioscorea zingiberensis TaxID=325984 RepID=A0A9D5HH10_9LILI|nr:hypothetical protein J5N97_018150 [Dioscorea zingiberensis]